MDESRDREDNFSIDLDDVILALANGSLMHGFWAKVLSKKLVNATHLMGALQKRWNLEGF